jgi:hypothetical protein
MDRSRLRKKVLLDLVSWPWALFPGVGGLTLMLLAGAANQAAPYVAFAGLASLLAGIGSLATRWIYRAEDVTKKAFEELQAEALKKEERDLDALDRRLRQEDDDPRTERHLAQLRRLYTGFRNDSTWATRMKQGAAVEIAQKVESLFRGCVHSLERSLELWQTAHKMATKDARAKVLEVREHLLEEIEQSIQQLARTIDEVQALAVKAKEQQDLAQIRQELNESLAVARRVEERMQALEAELGGPVTRSERE